MWVPITMLWTGEVPKWSPLTTSSNRDVCLNPGTSGPKMPCWTGRRGTSSDVQRTDCQGKSLEHCLRVLPPLSFSLRHSIYLHGFEYFYSFTFPPALYFLLSSLLFIPYLHTMNTYTNSISSIYVNHLSLQTFFFFYLLFICCHLFRPNQM